MTYSNEPDYVPADWIAAGYCVTEDDIDAILGDHFAGDLPSPTSDAIAAGQAERIYS
jgi:hypothetical protein